MPEFYMILARKKLSQYPNFYDICPTINEIPEFYMISARKMPELYVIIARKIFSRIWGNTCLSAPPTRLLCL